MKPTHLILLAAACMIIALDSCKKKSNGNPTKDNLVGTWNPTTEAKDANGNGVMDGAEVVAAYLYGGHKLAFNADGTVSILAINGGLSGEWTWALEQNNTYLRTADKKTGTNVVYQHMDNITSTAMTLKDTTGGVTTWYIFAKQ